MAEEKDSIKDVDINIYDDWQKEVLSSGGEMLSGTVTGNVEKIGTGFFGFLKGCWHGFRDSEPDPDYEYHDWEHGAWD